MAIEFSPNDSNFLITESNKAIATMFRDGKDIFDVFPAASLPSRNVEVPKFVRYYDLSKVDTRRAAGASPKQIRPRFEFESITLNNHTISVPIDSIEMGKMQALGTAGYAHIINDEVDALMYDVHKAAAAELSDTTNYDSGTFEYDIDSSSTEWGTTATATPKADFDELLKLFNGRQGGEPTTLIISKDVALKLKNTDAWSTYWDNKTYPATEEAAIARFFEVPDIYVKILNKYKGVDGSYTNYYDQTFVLATIDQVGEGELIGNITANRSAIRFYFLDQKDTSASGLFTENMVRTWAQQGIRNELLIKMWETVGNFNLTKYILGMTDWNIHVSNPNGLARFVNIYS